MPAATAIKDAAGTLAPSLRDSESHFEGIPVWGLKKNPPAGPARLLRTLVAGGLRPDALEAAAVLVALLDANGVDQDEVA